MPPLPVLVNAQAGNASPDADTLVALFREAGAEARVYTPLDIGALLGERPPVIVAAGGDGTVNAVASALVATDTALGVLPVGTFNHFARDIGMPLDLRAAARAIVAGRRRAVDVGEVNGRIFVNNSSIGLYPTMVHRRDKQQRRLGRGKWQAMLWALHTVLRSHPFLDLTLEIDGTVYRRRTPLVFIGNNEYRMEGFYVGLRERLDCGVLSLYLTHRGERLGLLLLGLRALFGRLQQAKEFEAARVTRVRIESRHTRLLVATDGEVDAFDLPLEYRVRPRALQVIVP
jgi:diacylglycerol kinase family enzyme